MTRSAPITYEVGQNVNNAILLPTNQWISPLGTRLQVNNARLVSSTLSPNGNYVAALSWNNFTGFLTILNVKTGQIVQQVGTGAAGDPTLGDGTVAADGPLYSPDGKTLWFPQSADLIRFTVHPNGTVSSPSVITLPQNANGAALPSGMQLSADGSKLYVALNGANTLGVINTATNQLVQQIPVGNAPPRAGSCSRGAPPTSPTRAAGTPTRPTSPTSPTGRRLSPIRAPAERSPGPSR